MEIACPVVEVPSVRGGGRICSRRGCFNKVSASLLMQRPAPIGTRRENGTIVTQAGEVVVIKIPMCRRDRERFTVLWWLAVRWCG